VGSGLLRRAGGGKGGVKVSVRVLLVFASFLIAYVVTRYAASFTGAPLGGGMEATPVTVVVIFAVFPLSLIVVLVIGNLAINRYFRGLSSK
jgi:hypothetical protein